MRSPERRILGPKPWGLQHRDQEGGRGGETAKENGDNTWEGIRKPTK